MELTSPQLKVSPLYVLLSLVLLAYTITPISAASKELCNPSDKNALLKIKAHFGPYDDNAFPLWDQERDCCNWFGVQCDNTNGRVTSFFINSSPNATLLLPPAFGDLVFLESLTLVFFSMLEGPIPPSFASLTKLQFVDLSFLGLCGAIPSFFGKFTKLNHLDLSTNKFTGTIPASLGSPTNLTYLDLSSNKLSGPIPDTLGKQTELINLDLSSNLLSGPLPSSLSHLTKVNNFDLRSNQLTGSIPGSYGSFNNPQTNLFFSNNLFSGPLPKSFGRVNVSFLGLDTNNFTGDASFLFARDKTAMVTIYLDDNRFKFDLSKVEFPIGLRNLDLRNNEIYGSIPKQLGQLPLVYVDVSFNQLCGPIPTGRRLKRFSPDKFAHNKCLCGVPLPPCN